MRKFLRKYLPFSKGVVESSINYRFRIILWSLAQYLTIVVTYFVWKAIYNNSPETIINGFTFTQMILYVFIVRIVNELTIGDIMGYVNNDIKSGAIAMHMIKPISYRIYIFFNGLGEKIVNIIFFIIPYTIILIIVGFNIGIEYQFNIVNFILFLISLLLSLLINYFVSFLFSIMIFYTVNNFGIRQAFNVINSVFSGMLIPLSFFPVWLYQITSVLPFMHALYIPTMLIMNKLSINEAIYSILYQLIWVIALGILLELVWRKTIRRLVILGG